VSGALSGFEYEAAGSVDEAVSLLSARGDRAKILAGGTDLLAQIHDGVLETNLVIDVKKIPERMEMHDDPAEGLRLGAAVPCYRIYEDPVVVATYPGLVDAARIIGGWQIQSRASVGGNLCNASPAADTIPPVMAYDGICHIAGPSGRRKVPAAEFCTAPGKSVLGRGELLTSIQLPPQERTTGAAYERFIPRNEMDIAAAGAASWVKLDERHDTILEARIALAAVAPRPLMAEDAMGWLAGKPVGEQTYVEAGEHARSAASPIDDKRGTREYRIHLVGVLVRRTLATAVERAKANRG